MLRRIALLASVLVIAGLPAAADEACKSRADLSWLLAPLPETASTPETAQLDLVSVERTGTHTRCMVTASCGSYNISCSVAGRCSGHDRACPSFQGHVTCNGVTTWCDPPCPECTNGQIMWVPTGGCCNDLTEKDKYKCINELWEYQGTFCKVPLCGPF